MPNPRRVVSSSVRVMQRAGWTADAALSKVIDCTPAARLQLVSDVIAEFHWLDQIEAEAQSRLSRYRTPANPSKDGDSSDASTTNSAGRQEQGGPGRRDNLP